MVIHFVRDGELLGQYPEDGVAHLVKAHAIMPTDYYWHEGMAEWASVASRWMPIEPVAPAVASTKTAPAFSTAAVAG